MSTNPFGNQHAFCSPSDWEGWSNCPGKPALQEDEPDPGSADAKFGTQAHEWAATLLRRPAIKLDLLETVPDDMREGLRLYVEAVRARVKAYEMAGARVTLLVEQKLDISQITTEKDAKGTADVLIIAGFETYSILDVWDLKFGMGVIHSPVENGQEMIYALAAVLQLQTLHTFSQVNLVIHQPRVQAEPKEWQTTVEHLYAFGQRVTEAATLSLSLRGDVAALSHLKPGDHCRKTFCRVQHRCPALKAYVETTVLRELTGVTDPKSVATVITGKTLNPDKQAVADMLSKAMSAVPLVESWCLAVRSATDKALLAGESIPGWKLVTGRKGNRDWTDEDAVSMLLLGSGVPRATLFGKAPLRSPAQLEKLLPADAWTSVGELIKQADGKPSAVPEADPRPAWTPVSAADFESHKGEDLV